MPLYATIATVGRVSHNEDHESVLHVVAHFAWAGASHLTQHAMMAQLVVGTFDCAKVVIDVTGLGAAPAAFLARRVGVSPASQRYFARSSSSVGGAVVDASHSAVAFQRRTSPRVTHHRWCL